MTQLNDSIKVDLYGLVTALSEALGLVGGKVVNHGQRVAYMALSLAEPFDLTVEEYSDLCFAALLHDAGISNMRTHENLARLDWEEVKTHCREGARLLESIPRFERVARLVYHHHDHWSELTTAQVDERTALLSNLIFLADRIDVSIDWARELILNREPIEGHIRNLSGTVMNPEAVKAFLRASKIEVFWLSLYPRHLSRAMNEVRPEDGRMVGLSELEIFARTFATIVDNKSSFTHDHSEGVARLCHHFAMSLGLLPQRAQELRVAALLHDLGKLAVPDEILEKPETLTPDEFQIVKRHPFEIYHILSGLPALSEIKDWAAFHHEKMDGSGYPFHHSAAAFNLEHLIVMISDIIQALIQERPYRPSLAQDQVLDILKHLTNRQTAFEPIMEVVTRDYDQVAAVARGQGSDYYKEPEYSSRSASQRPR